METQTTKESFEMVKSLENSGKLMIIKRSSVLGSVSKVDVIYRRVAGDPDPKVVVEEGEICVLLRIFINDKKM